MADTSILADKLGIARDYLDVTQKLVTIPQDRRDNALRLMGYPIDDEKALLKKVTEEENSLYKNILDYVQVLVDGDLPFIYLRTKADLRESASISWTLEFEDGTKISEVQPLYEIEIADYKTVHGTEYDIRRFILDRDIPYGYHHFSCVITDGYSIFNSITMSLIRTPSKGYVPEELKRGERLWGVSIQLYALRSKHNWGVGDFADLSELLSHIASCGGQFVGLNPLHAGYPANPDPDNCSPYSPSSRQWLNVVYISVPDVPEYVQCEEAVRLVGSKAFQQKLAALRSREYIDYRGVLELKLSVLRLIFSKMKVDDRRSLRGRMFIDFVEQGGRSLQSMATFDAMQAYFYSQGINAWGWPAFPKEYRDCDSPFVDVWRQEHADDVLFYCYLQFLAREQMDNSFAVAKKAGMAIGTYRDLAVGVAEGSCDVWNDKDGVYRREGSVGAPPDPLGPLGQSWGLAPMSPQALKRVAYKPMIDLYRSNMEACGALRIDHAAGLYRFWWLRQGESSQTGAYVLSNMHDLIGIICLESMRHKTMIIAEDLGTIPEELRVALKKACFYSYKLFFGERAYDGGFIDPKLYEPHAMAALTTHDMAPLKSWWSGDDLKLSRKLGVYNDEDLQRLTIDRMNSKQRILDSMHFLGSIGDDVPYRAEETELNHALAKGMQVHLSRSACALYSSQLEDWTFVDKPVNVPGTFREYPNWRRKLTRDIDDIFSDKFVKELTEAMTRARKE